MNAPSSSRKNAIRCRSGLKVLVRLFSAIAHSYRPPRPLSSKERRRYGDMYKDRRGG
jgi:hypothetical protein